MKFEGQHSIDGYRICRGYGRSLIVYEEYPSGERRRVGRCESMGGAKRLIRRDKERRKAERLTPPPRTP